jgi:hypothetical protein
LNQAAQLLFDLKIRRDVDLGIDGEDGAVQASRITENWRRIIQTANAIQTAKVNQ